MISYASIVADLPEFEALGSGQTGEWRRNFVMEFVSDPKRNATRAYAKVRGLSNDPAAAAAASRLLRDVKVQAAVKAMEDRIRSETCLLPRLIAVLEAVAFTDLRDVITWDATGKIKFKPSDQLTPQASAALLSIQEIVEEKQPRLPGMDDAEDVAVNVARRAVKLHPKLDAVKLLAQLTGIGSAQRIEITGVSEQLEKAWARAEAAKGGDHVAGS